MTCDRALATASGLAPTEAASNHPHLVLATTILASSLAFIDGSVVNVGLPTIGRSFHSTASDLQWWVNAYLLPGRGGRRSIRTTLTACRRHCGIRTGLVRLRGRQHFDLASG